MNGTTIKEWRDLLEAAENAQTTLRGISDENYKPWYRGHACLEEDARRWTLVPSVYRDVRPNCSKGEKWLLGQFMMRAPSRYAACPKNQEHAIWLTLARHYGLKTRLLDWTESILVAAFFAVSDTKHDGRDGAIWAINPHSLNECQCDDRAVNPLFSKPASHVVCAAFGVPARDADEEKKQQRILAAWAPERDLRMLVQQSAYTIHGCDKALEDLPSALEVSDKKGPFLCKYVIPSASKQQLRKTLESVGYTAASLHPDLDHLAVWLNGTVT